MPVESASWRIFKPSPDGQVDQGAFPAAWRGGIIINDPVDY